MKELLMKLRKERMELTGKIRKIEKFRATDEWNKLTVNHKQLLDIQLQAMRTYLEALIGRCLDIEQFMTEKTTNEEKQEEDEPRVIVINISELLDKIKD